MSIKKRRSFADEIDGYLEYLEKEFQRWMGILVERPSWNQKASSMEPLRDLRVTPTEVVVTVDLPFTEKSTLRVEPMDESTLEISAKMKRKMTFKEMGITHYKGEFQKLHCHIRVPVPVQMNKMEIYFKKGILGIHLPRKHGS